MRLKSRRRPRTGPLHRQHRRGTRHRFSKFFIACHNGNDSDTDVDDIQQNDGHVQRFHLGNSTHNRYEVQHYEEIESRISFSSDEECLMACETRALVAPPGDVFTQMRSSTNVASSSMEPPSEERTNTEPTSHCKASAMRHLEPNYHHSDMQALLDADLSDDDNDTTCFHDNNTANHPLTGNGLDHVVFSFQRQFLLSNPRRQNWPWNITVGGTNKTDTDPGLQTMFHEGSSGRRNLSSSSAIAVNMPHTAECSADATVSQETNPKTFNETLLGAPMRDTKTDSDMDELFSVEELFGVSSVCDITDSETFEAAMNPSGDRTTSSSSTVSASLSASCATDDKDCDVDYGDNFRAIFYDGCDGQAGSDSVLLQEANMADELTTDSGELQSVHHSMTKLSNEASSSSLQQSSEVSPDFSVAVAECDYDVMSPNNAIDLPNTTDTFHEQLAQEWNNACMTDSSLDSDTDSDKMDNTTDTIETYLTDSSESTELSTNVSDNSVSIDCRTDNNNVSVSEDISVMDHDSMISLQSAATTNSDSLVNENTRVLFMMTDSSERRPPLRWSPCYQSPMGSVNSDSLINGQNRELFTAGNWDDQAVDNSQNMQNDTSPNVSQANDWYVYDDRLTAELNSLRHLVDMHNYLQTQHCGIIGPPPYEECTVSPGTEDDVTSRTEECRPDTPRGPPPAYTEQTHAESPPPNYEQLSDHSNSAQDNQPESLALLFQPPTAHECNGQDQQENVLEDQTNDVVGDGCATLDLGTVVQCHSSGGGHDRVSSIRSNPPSYHHPVFSLGHHLPLRWNTTAGVNQWASSHMWASFHMPS